MLSFYKHFLFFITILSFICSCSYLVPPEEIYNNNRITLQFLDLYNQRSLQSRHLRGNWSFRRERLALIDKNLKEFKPDILIFQRSMQRNHSKFESDKHILTAGSLQGYKWEISALIKHKDTEELESNAVAYTLPFKKPTHFKANEKNKTWYYKGGSISFIPLNLEGQKVAIFNLKEPSEYSKGWYSAAAALIKLKKRKHKICSKRVIVAGKMSSQVYGIELQYFKHDLQLEDISNGFCEIESKCITASPQNELYFENFPLSSPERNDRILVPKSAQIFLSKRNFDSGVQFPSTIDQIYPYRLLWPSEHFGWIGTFKLAQCQ